MEGDINTHAYRYMNKAREYMTYVHYSPFLYPHTKSSPCFIFFLTNNSDHRQRVYRGYPTWCSGWSPLPWGSPVYYCRRPKNGHHYSCILLTCTVFARGVRTFWSRQSRQGTGREKVHEPGYLRISTAIRIVFCNKILENVHSRLYDYFVFHYTLQDSICYTLIKFSLHKNKSPYLAIICASDELVSAWKKGEVIIGNIIDFKKAFDTVGHILLLDELLINGYLNIYQIDSNLLDTTKWNHILSQSNVKCHKVLTLVFISF